MCKYCEANNGERESILTRYDYEKTGEKKLVDVFILNSREKLLAVSAPASLGFEGFSAVRINYCPMCGRKLGGE